MIIEDKQISEITKCYRSTQELTQEQFAEALCEHIPGIESYTKQFISSIENGRDEFPYSFILLVYVYYIDWRRDWALEVLRVMKPRIWEGLRKPVSLVRE